MTHAESFRQIINNDQAFIASWFDDSIVAIHPTFKRAIEDCGFTPQVINAKEFNGDVVDEIIGEIRRSRFIVADLTGHRGGVYFEAGFGMGLGLPVIFTCREDDFIKDGKKLAHFDVEHLNFILWKDEAELYTRLKNRIAATIPLPNTRSGSLVASA